MEFALLGGTAVLSGGGAVDLGPARQRCVLAALAMDAGLVVSVNRLIDRVWGEQPPPRARTIVVRCPGGHSLQAERSTVDVVRFQDLCEQARAGDDRQAAVLLRQALGLWRGEVLRLSRRAR